MKYNFDEPVSRRGTCSYKWDSAAPDVVPIWVAARDIRGAPALTDALQQREAQGVFGDPRVPEA